MNKQKAIKIMVCAASTALFISLPAVRAHAENTRKVEQGVAGIASSLDQLDDAEDLTENKEIIKALKTEFVNQYANLGVSKAADYVNVRSKPSTDSEVVGKLYQGCAANILEWLEGDWVKIQSGDVKGYIASNFLATGKDAEKMADEFATKYATVVNTKTLRVREKCSTDARTLELIPEGETYIVLKENDKWAKILLGSDDDGKDFTGFVSKDYVNITVDFKEAISIEEENRIKKEQEEAERAEEERKRKQAEEEAERQAEAEEEKRRQQENNNSSYDDTPSSHTDTSDLSSLRSEIISYAKKFVGCPYEWGGTSLSNGADCSGFVYRIYSDFGYSIPRSSSEQAEGAGVQINISDRKPGDLVFYGDSNGNVNHVAMYIGNDMIVQAANSRQGIIISQYNYRNVIKMRRVVY